MSWSRKPIQKGSDSSLDYEIGLPVSSGESTGKRFEQFIDKRGDEKANQQ